MWRAACVSEGLVAAAAGESAPALGAGGRGAEAGGGRGEPAGEAVAAGAYLAAQPHHAGKGLLELF